MPREGELSDMIAERGWPTVEPGGMLRVNVIPQEHEFLDWDKPFSEQSPQVQDRISNFMRKAFEIDPGQEITVPPDMTGQKFYNSVQRWLGPNSWAKPVQEMGNDLVRNWVGPEPGTGWTYPALASKILDQNGIPGMKFLDRASRMRTTGPEERPVIKHNRDWAGSPMDQDLHDRYVVGQPVVEGGLDESVRNLTSNLREQADQYGKFADFARTAPALHREGSLPRFTRMRDQFNDMADWIEQEHQNGHLSVGDNRNRNFVVYDPRNLQIQTWNGIPASHIDYDPFLTGSSGAR
jgi:hypothetical protein